MECLAAFLFIVILIGVMMTFASQAHAGAERWGRAFSVLARRHGGWYKSGGWFGRPSVMFRYGATSVQVESVAAGRPKRRYLQVHIRYPDQELRCEAFPRRVNDRGPFRGMEDVTSGLGGFESEYVIRSEDDAATRRFLSDGVQLQMNRIRYLLGNDDIYVSVQRGRLLIKKAFPRHGGHEQIEDLVQLAIDLYDQAVLARSAAIDFVEHQTLGSIDECVCMVCGEELLEDIVLCRRCKTPHHRDCWMYYGACSTYGCKEPHFVAPRLSQPIPDPPHAPESASLE
jgi:hypothetical protein